MGTYGGFSNKPEMGHGNWYLDSNQDRGSWYKMKLLCIVTSDRSVLLVVKLMRSELLDAIPIPSPGLQASTRDQRSC